MQTGKLAGADLALAVQRPALDVIDAMKEAAIPISSTRRLRIAVEGVIPHATTPWFAHGWTRPTSGRLTGSACQATKMSFSTSVVPGAAQAISATIWRSCQEWTVPESRTLPLSSVTVIVFGSKNHERCNA